VVLYSTTMVDAVTSAYPSPPPERHSMRAAQHRQLAGPSGITGEASSTTASRWAGPTTHPTPPFDRTHCKSATPCCPRTLCRYVPLSRPALEPDRQASSTLSPTKGDTVPLPLHSGNSNCRQPEGMVDARQMQYKQKKAHSHLSRPQPGRRPGREQDPVDGNVPCGSGAGPYWYGHTRGDPSVGQSESHVAMVWPPLESCQGGFLARSTPSAAQSERRATLTPSASEYSFLAMPIWRTHAVRHLNPKGATMTIQQDICAY